MGGGWRQACRRGSTFYYCSLMTMATPRMNPATPEVGKAGTSWPADEAPSCPFPSSSCLYADGAEAEALLPLVRALLPPLRG
jgi:hypothetical protein